MTNLDLYFKVARERYMMKLRKENGYDGPPWSDDPVLASHRFCNVFREDDKTTVWLRENVRDPMCSQPGVLFAICAVRFFNRIETAARLVDLELHQFWNAQKAYEALKDVSPIVGGAYVVHTPNNQGLDKLQGVIHMLNAVWRDHLDMEQRICGLASMEAATDQLTVYPSVGKFVAYQIAADLRYTWVLDHATDVLTWAQIGPGSSKGLGWVFHNDPTRYSYTSRRDTEQAQPLMRELLAASQDEWNWPQTWPAWDMQTVQNWLCEFSKYQAGLRGERLKRKYP